MDGQVLSPKKPGDRSNTPKQNAELAATQRRLPVGAEVVPGSGVHFRVWAPKSQRVCLLLSPGPEFNERNLATCELKAEEGGYFSGLVPDAKAGSLYKYQLDSGVFPDPASRFQPFGPHGPSEVINPAQFRWSDGQWRG